MEEGLEIEQLIVQRFVRISFDRLANQVSHFVGVLTACRNANTSGPIVVKITQLVTQTLQNVRTVVRLVVDYYVVRGGHAALTHRLWH